MDWKEMIKNFKLADLQIKLKDLIKGKQIGIVNVYREENYHINITEEMAERIVETKINEVFENLVKNKALLKLEMIAPELNLLSESTAVSIVASTMATSTIEVSLTECCIVTDKMEAEVIKAK